MRKKRSRAKKQVLPLLLPLEMPFEFVQMLMEHAEQHEHICDEPPQKVPARQMRKGLPKTLAKKWDSLDAAEQELRVLLALLVQGGHWRDVLFEHLSRPIHSTIIYDSGPGGMIFSVGGRPRQSVVILFGRKNKIGSIVYMTEGNMEPIFPRGPAESPEEALVFHKALHQILDFARSKFPDLSIGKI